MQDVETHANREMRPGTNNISVAGYIAQQTGIDRGTIRYAMFGNIDSWRNICKLAGWAKLYLDEYRKEEDGRHSYSPAEYVDSQED
jgi:hypothetical protein